jgi:guanosine-3',5'-bis(diphosphate) 3'-pyrophosphohydrolase
MNQKSSVQENPYSVSRVLMADNVASLVEELTDDKSLPKEVRKQEQVRNAPHKSQRAKTIKLADKISNLRAITASPPQDWTVRRRLEYVRRARDVVAGLRGVNPRLEAEFDKVAAAAEESVRP